MTPNIKTRLLGILEGLECRAEAKSPLRQVLAGMLSEVQLNPKQLALLLSACSPTLRKELRRRSLERASDLLSHGFWDKIVKTTTVARAYIGFDDDENEDQSAHEKAVKSLLELIAILKTNLDNYNLILETQTEESDGQAAELSGQFDIARTNKKYAMRFISDMIAFEVIRSLCDATAIYGRMSRETLDVEVATLQRLWQQQPLTGAECIMPINRVDWLMAALAVESPQAPDLSDDSGPHLGQPAA